MFCNKIHHSMFFFSKDVVTQMHTCNYISSILLHAVYFYTQRAALRVPSVHLHASPHLRSSVSTAFQAAGRSPIMKLHNSYPALRLHRTLGTKSLPLCRDLSQMFSRPTLPLPKLCTSPVLIDRMRRWGDMCTRSCFYPCYNLSTVRRRC